MFIETKEGQTHATCEEQLKKYGGKAKCCLCNKHDGCDLADSHGMFSKKEMTKAIKHAVKVSKKEQDKVLNKSKVGRCYKITPFGYVRSCYVKEKEGGSAISDWLAETSMNDGLTIKVVEMSDDEFNNLPDFEL